MDANYGGIDHLQPTIMGLGDGIHEAVPNTCFAPSDKAIVAGGAWAVPLWQIAPWRTGSQHPEDAVQHAAVSLRVTALTAIIPITSAPVAFLPTVLVPRWLPP